MPPPSYPPQPTGYPPQPGYSQQPGYPPQHSGGMIPQASAGARVAAILLGVIALGTGLYVVVDVLDNSSWTTSIPRLIGGLLLLAGAVLLFFRLRLAALLAIASSVALLAQIIVTAVIGIQQLEPGRGETIADALYNWADYATFVPVVILTLAMLLPPVFKSLKPLGGAAPYHVPAPHNATVGPQQYR